MHSADRMADSAHPDQTVPEQSGLGLRCFLGLSFSLLRGIWVILKTIYASVDLLLSTCGCMLVWLLKPFG